MPISKPDLKDLFEYVDAHVQPKGCNGKLRAARMFLILRSLLQEPIITWLEDQGGGCDCEVILDLEENWGEDAWHGCIRA